MGLTQQISRAIRRHMRLAVVVCLTLAAYAGAISRPQDLPWLVAAMLTATLIVGLIWPHWLVRRLSVVRHGPHRAEEGESITFDVAVRNHGLLPRFMVELVDRLASFDVEARDDPAAAKTLGIIGYVAGRSTRRFAVPFLCEKRGYYVLEPIGMASSFPLGLARAWHEAGGNRHTLTVYPSVFPIVRLPLRGAPSEIHRGGYLLPEGAGAAEFSGLREYREGDSPRHIHWPTTARTSELMVKQYEPLASARLYIVLDLLASSNLGQGREATLEYGVRIAASVARFACFNNIRTRMLAQGATRFEVEAASGPHQYQRILDQLAVVAADGDTAYAALLNDVAARVIDGETVLVFLSERFDASRTTMDALLMLRSKRANLLAIVFDRTGFIEQVTNHDTQSDQTMTVLQEIGAACVRVRRGDDLFQLFNA